MHERQDVRTAMERLLQATGVDARSVRTDVAGAGIHHLEAGSGPALVLLHGGTGGGANWFRMIGSLVPRFCVHAPDLPGFGLSDAIPALRPLGGAAADRLLEWMERANVSDALVVGTSFGGLAGLRLAQRTTRVSRLLLLDSAGLGRRIHPTVRFVAAAPFTALSVRPSRRGTAAVFRGLLTTDRSAIPADQQDLLIDYLVASARAAGTAYLSTTLRGFVGAAGQREVLSRAELTALHQPLSIVWGARDRLLPVAHACRAADWMPDAALHVLPGVGHSPNWEQPEAVIDAIIALADRRSHALPDPSGR